MTRQGRRDPGPALGGLAAVAVIVAGAWLAFTGGPAHAAGPGPSAAGPASASGSPAAATVTSAAVVGEGRQLFLQNCAACHGVQGQGTSSGPDIRQQGAAGAAYALLTGRMPLPDPNQQAVRRPPQFPPDQIQALIAYVASLGNGPAIPAVTTDGADLARGRDLFINNCAACHSASGAGDAVGGGFIAPSLHEADPETVGNAMKVGPGAMPVFNLPLTDMNDIAAYVQYLRNPQSPGGIPMGGVGPVPEGFVAGTIGIALLLIVVRFVGARPSRNEPAHGEGAEGPGGGDGAAEAPR